MRRNVSLEEISDGNLYGENDMVKADCQGCQGCFQCCVGMGKSVILDPYDLCRLQQGLGKGREEFLAEGVLELNVVDGAVLPNLKMVGKEERCAFLNGEGRCDIHQFRPGICRLFPLGRYYEEGDFRYFLQTGECRAPVRSKVKAGKWIDTPDRKRYHDYICSWHFLLKQLETAGVGADAENAGMDRAKELNMALLQIFFMRPYETGKDFYEQYSMREKEFQGMLFPANCLRFV